MADFLDKLLEEAINELEREASKHQFNVFCIQDSATIARLVGRDSLLPRITVVWEKASEFTNRPDIFRSLRLEEPLDLLLQYHPVYPKNSLPTIVATTEPHIALSVQRRYDEAYRIAKSELALEDIAATQIVIGDFDAAKETLQKIETRTSTRDLQIVFILELFRRDRNDEAENLLNDLRNNGIKLSEYIHLAYGLAGREPWSGYPYFDY